MIQLFSNSGRVAFFMSTTEKEENSANMSLHMKYFKCKL
jgi:hypothetical protein